MGRCSEFVEAQYGFPCDSVERVVVLNAAAPVQVMQNNPDRVAWSIFNLGANLGYIAFSSGVAALFGITLAAAGGMDGINARDEGVLPVREVWGIGAGATTLYVVETRGIK